MATSTLPVTFRASPLPSNFRGTPQQIMDAMVARLSIVSEEEFSLFVSGPTAPTSNVGPWLKNGITWYVWDNSTGSYIPEVLEFQSLRFVASQAAPSQALYTFWIELDGAGKAQAIKYYSGGAWKDVYEDKFALYSTTTQMDAAIANSVLGERVNYSTIASTGGTQTVQVDTFLHKLEYNNEIADPDGVYDPALFRFTAVQKGIYFVTAKIQVDNDTADATSMGLALRLGKNGSAALPVCNGATAVASPPGDRWFLNFAGMIEIGSTDYLEVFLSGDDGTNTGQVTASNGDWSVHLVRLT